jgi:hypothetical protein
MTNSSQWWSKRKPTASERIRAARARRNAAKLEKYGPAYCDCLRCRILRFTED